MVEWLFKLRFLPALVSVSPLKNSIQENKWTKHVKMNLLTNTPAIFLNLEKRNILLVLYTKIPKLNGKENIDIGVKML